MVQFKKLHIEEQDFNPSEDVQNIIRVDVDTDEEAEALLAQHKGKFKNPMSAVIEGDHKSNPKDNKECNRREFDSNGKLKE